MMNHRCWFKTSTINKPNAMYPEDMLQNGRTNSCKHNENGIQVHKVGSFLPNSNYLYTANWQTDSSKHNENWLQYLAFASYQVVSNSCQVGFLVITFTLQKGRQVHANIMKNSFCTLLLLHANWYQLPVKLTSYQVGRDLLLHNFPCYAIRIQGKFCR